MLAELPSYFSTEVFDELFMATDVTKAPCNATAMVAMVDDIIYFISRKFPEDVLANHDDVI